MKRILEVTLFVPLAIAMPKGDAGRWEHTHVTEVGTCMDGCCADYECKDCGHRWREELPQ